MTLQPTVNQIGKELEALGYVTFGKRAYNQKENNCFEIACYLAEMFGHIHPQSLRELKDLIRASKERQIWGEDNLSREKTSEACFVIRTPDYLRGLSTPVHVVFELNGKEFNYGPGTREGFTIERRIYLRKKTEEN